MNKVFFVLIVLIFFGCSEESSYQTVETPVTVSLEDVPYSKLSEYNFFIGELNNLNPHPDLLLYKPNSELFTDYAKKVRYVWLPKNKKATFISENDPLNLPVGSVLIKVFYYDASQLNSESKIIETRLMIRKSEDWIFANYKWNETQTEAYYDMSSSTVPITLHQNNQTTQFDYKIPSESQCITCHFKETEPTPIGIKPIHLNNELSGINQLQNWINKGFLNQDLPQDIHSVVDYSDSSKSLIERARAYLDIQCAHCHNPEGTAYYLPLNFSYHQTQDLQNMGVCMPSTMNIPSMDRGYIVAPQNPDNSALLYMISTNETQFKMPRIGREIQHQEGIELITQWINSLEDCQ